MIFIFFMFFKMGLKFFRIPLKKKKWKWKKILKKRKIFLNRFSFSFFNKARKWKRKRFYSTFYGRIRKYRGLRFKLSEVVREWHKKKRLKSMRRKRWMRRKVLRRLKSRYIFNYTVNLILRRVNREVSRILPFTKETSTISLDKYERRAFQKFKKTKGIFIIRKGLNFKKRGYSVLCNKEGFKPLSSLMIKQPYKQKTYFAWQFRKRFRYKRNKRSRTIFRNKLFVFRNHKFNRNFFVKNIMQHVRTPNLFLLQFKQSFLFFWRKRVERIYILFLSKKYHFFFKALQSIVYNKEFTANILNRLTLSLFRFIVFFFRQIRVMLNSLRAKNTFGFFILKEFYIYLYTQFLISIRKFINYIFQHYYKQLIINKYLVYYTALLGEKKQIIEEKFQSFSEALVVRERTKEEYVKKKKIYDNYLNWHNENILFKKLLVDLGRINLSYEFVYSNSMLFMKNSLITKIMELNYFFDLNKQIFKKWWGNFFFFFLSSSLKKRGQYNFTSHGFLIDNVASLLDNKKVIFPFPIYNIISNYFRKKAKKYKSNRLLRKLKNKRKPFWLRRKKIFKKFRNKGISQIKVMSKGRKFRFKLYAIKAISISLNEKMLPLLKKLVYSIRRTKVKLLKKPNERKEKKRKEKKRKKVLKRLGEKEKKRFEEQEKKLAEQQKEVFYQRKIKTKIFQRRLHIMSLIYFFSEVNLLLQFDLLTFEKIRKLIMQIQPAILKRKLLKSRGKNAFEKGLIFLKKVIRSKLFMRKKRKNLRRISVFIAKRKKEIKKKKIIKQIKRMLKKKKKRDDKNEKIKKLLENKNVFETKEKKINF